MLFTKHPAWLWLKKYRSSLLAKTDEGAQAIFDDGKAFESYAEKIFPDAIKISTGNYDDYNEYLLLPSRTQKAIESSARVLLQGRLEADGCTCIFDCLERVSGTTFNLYEIKASTKVKAEHETDLAFQVIVLEKAGLTINAVSVIHVNSEYVRMGDIEPEKLTVKVDVTNAVRNKIYDVEEIIEKAKALLSEKKMPDLSPRHASNAGYSEWKNIYLSIVGDTDPYRIYHLCSTNPTLIGEFEDKGFVSIADIPDDILEKSKQSNQVKAVKEKTRSIDTKKIHGFLDNWQYPLYFFDYETYAGSIPSFDGQKPHKDYPFQYSLHVLNSPNGKLAHREYLHTENSDPTKPLIEHLKSDIGEVGTIVSWNQSYEKNINKTLSELYPEHKEFLLAVNARMEDLMIPFWNDWIVDKDFFGSASIKKVLPAMVPELSYRKLSISNGLSARSEWMQTVLLGKNDDIKDHIVENLRKYCQLDTFAMVRIWEELVKIVTSSQNAL